MTVWQKLGRINKATVIPVVGAIVWAVNKYAVLKWDADEQLMVATALATVLVFLVRNKEPEQ